MPRSGWTNDEKAFLAENYKRMSYAEIGRHLGKPTEQVKGAAQRYGVTVTRAWPDEHLEILRRDYPVKPAREIATALGRKVSAVYGMAKKLGLKKPPEWWRSEKSGRHNLAKGTQTRFERGFTPWNKGRKTGPAHPNSKRTQFKKGQRPHNALPVGTIVAPDGYMKIKIAEPDLWEFYHRHVWRQHNGPVPDDMLVRFRDGDPMNCAIENLKLVSRAEHALYNSQWDIPDEVVPALAALSALKKEIRNAKKQNRGSAEHAVRDDGASSR